MDRMFLCGMLEWISSMDILIITKSLSQWDGISLFSAEEVSLIEEVAEEFKKMIK